MPDYTFAITGQDMSGAAWKTFIDNVKKANQQLADLKKPMQDAASSSSGVEASMQKLTGAIDFVKGGLKGLAGLWIVNQVREYAAGVQDAAVKVADLAKSSGLTTDQVQALQRAARIGGEEFDKLAEYAKVDTEWLDRVTESARRAGTVMGGDTVKSINDVAKASEQAKREAGDLGDKLQAMSAPAVSWGMTQVAGGMRSISESLDLIRVNGGAALPTIREIANILTGGQASRLFGDSADSRIEGDLRRLEQQAATAKKNLSLFDAPAGAEHPQAKKAREAARETALREVKDTEDALMAAQRADMLRRQTNQTRQQERDTRLFNRPIDAEIAEWSRYGAKPAPGGGGGGGPRDRIGENLQLYTDQAKAAQDALTDLRAVAMLPLPLDDLEREIKLRKAIADAMAQASKFAKDDPRKAQLEQQIRLRETAESEYQRFNAALKTADATERQYGNGQLQFLQTQNNLNDARATGRLTLEAYDIAMKINAQTTEDLRLKNLGLQGGLPGFMAGWQNAQNQFERANNAWAAGGKTFELVTSTMDQGLAQFVRNGKVELGDLVGNFFLSIAQMEARLAVSSLLGGGDSGGGGGILGAVISGIGAAFGGYSGTSGATSLYGSASSTLGSMSFGGPRAGGGPVSSGMGYIVGENGPEWFAPNSGGNVINRQQLDALGVGGGGGGDVHVHLGGITMGEFVSPAQHRRDIMQVQKAAKEGAQEAFLEKRRRAVPSVKRAFA